MPRGNLLTNEERKKKYSNRRLKLVGLKFGRLTVLEDVGNNKKGSALWKSKCDCGTVKNISSDDLKNHNIRSCGCLLIERWIKKIYNHLFNSY